MSAQQEFDRILKYETESSCSSGGKDPIYFEEFRNPYLQDEAEERALQKCSSAEGDCSLSSTEWSNINREDTYTKQPSPTAIQNIFCAKDEEIAIDYDAEEPCHPYDSDASSESNEISHHLDVHFSIYEPFNATDAPNEDITEASPQKRKIEMNIIPLSDLEKCYKYPQVDAAKKLGVNISTLKKSCKEHGIYRWPHRRIAGIDRKILQVEASLSNLMKMKKLDQDQIVLNALQDRLAALEEERRTICDEARHPKPSSAEPATEIKQQNNIEQENSQKICAEATGNTDHSEHKLSGTDSGDADNSNNSGNESPEFLPPIVTSTESSEQTKKRRLRHQALQDRFEVSSPFLQLKLIHDYALSMIDEKKPK